MLTGSLFSWLDIYEPEKSIYILFVKTPCFELEMNLKVLEPVRVPLSDFIENNEYFTNLFI